MKIQTERSTRSAMQQEAGIANQIAYIGRDRVLFRADDNLAEMTFHARPMLELLEVLSERELIVTAGERWRRTSTKLEDVQCKTVTDEVEPVRKLRALLDERSAVERPLYSINLDDLLIDDSGILSPIVDRKSHGKASADLMYRLDAGAQCVQRAVDALCRQQMATQMDEQDYINALVSVNFPLHPAKLLSYSELPGYELVGFLDHESRLHSFGLYFVKQAPEFAGSLITQAHKFAHNQDPKTYLYLVLVRPDMKNRGYGDAIYQQLDVDSKKQGNVGCAIEIHQINTRSILKHLDLGFKFMGTYAEHERIDPLGAKRKLLYGQYYRPVD